MAPYLSDVAIIGAGLGGCAFALALSSQGIPVTLYEARAKDNEVFTSGVSLTPNGLQVLDRLGIFERIRSRSWITTHRTFKNSDDETVRKFLVSHKDMYGYSNHRLWRKILIEEMRSVLAERGVEIHFGSKFNGIVENKTSSTTTTTSSGSSTNGETHPGLRFAENESGEGVTFLINQVPHTASMVFGFDGVYSTVRRQMYPNVKPHYEGIVGILAHFTRSEIDWPSADYEPAATIQGEPGALFFIPEDAEGTISMVGMQFEYPEQSRAEFESMAHDHDRLMGFFRKDYDQWGPTARKIIDQMDRETDYKCYSWPFVKIPELPNWATEDGRVVLMGDAAHAVPPSSGQGVNQALEDAWSMALLLFEVNKREQQQQQQQSVAAADGEDHKQFLLDALKFWQGMRQERVDGVYGWAVNVTNINRLPEAARAKVLEKKGQKPVPSSRADDMSWLYRPRLEDDVREWVQARS